GLAGDDSLTGGLGNDTLDGGAGNDVFVFSATIGSDRIINFEDGVDLIRFSGYGQSLDSFDDLRETDTGADVRIDLGRYGSIVLAGIADTTTIDASDFAWV
ncbi:MAG TPA: calcium-binding protein, partial [Rhodospirillales bacterium]|nr:calcium-binding protein [Rhodospirillales bacterium]